MAPKAKQSITLEKLLEIGKDTLKEPNVELYTSDDANVVVAAHLPFFLAVAPHTRRLNPVSVGQVAKELFKSGGREAQLFGQSLAQAFGHCMLAGGKAKTGQKLSKEVWSGFQATNPDAAKAAEVKSEIKRESPGVKTDSPPRPAKLLKTCLSSPSQIAALYAGGSSSSSCETTVKVMHNCGGSSQTPRRHRRTLPPLYVYIYTHTCRRHSRMPPWNVYIYIYTYIFILCLA